ncbi:Leucine carboxyl methyltransferase/Galactose oxidase, central domain/Cupin-like domain/Cupin superfamily protein, putative [Angomonas deanei]|uniref:tRNA wybutosine-synthesizing protein 4 n=1 Tax=Angomonas deanei TaxID=59799 RepID=A0A7G2CB30_9TRYP|nr:Leucine carboxyl methyltransferase/Galactose oxidase, central domain/Cupin-like domain/Cupin superfamily protein, putative [Angomonas deanei]
MENTPPETISKRKEKKAKRVNKKISLPGSVDVRVQHTNDDSVVSKRSAVSCGYVADPFLRLFVRKPTRRSPLVNRGYYLRMVVMTDLITKCIEKCLAMPSNSSHSVQVISLGAGYDTFALRYLLGDQAHEHSGPVHFYDVDFPEVMQSKAALMSAAPPGTFPVDWSIQYENAANPVSSASYSAVGVDLRRSEEVLLESLQNVSSQFSSSNLTIVYAECVMQYMPAEKAASLIQTLATHFPNLYFFAYDQLHPSDSFGKVMTGALQQKQSPLLSVATVPGGTEMIARAKEGGMRHVRFANFYDLSRQYIDESETERERVDRLEAFDEFEEWGEMCEHYGITFATTAKEPMQLGDCFTGCEAKTPGLPSNKQVSVHHWPSGRFGFAGWGNGNVHREELANGDVLLVSFGGFDVIKQHQRVNTFRVHSLREGEVRTVLQENEHTPPGLVFHSFDRLGPFTYVVAGGRTSPTSVNGDVFIFKLHMTATQEVSINSTLSVTCTRIASGSSLTERYRHASVVIGDNKLLLVGGKNSSGQCVTEACLLEIQEGQAVTVQPITLEGLPPLFSAAAAKLSDGRILLCGGVNCAFKAYDTMWYLDIGKGKVDVVQQCAALERFSHTATTVQLDGEEFVLIVGGTSTRPKEVVNLDPIFYNVKSGQMEVPHVEGELPSWSRHACVELASGVIGVVGGGYTCFSFATFTAKPALLYLSPDAEQNMKRCLVASRESLPNGTDPTVGANIQRLSNFLCTERERVRELTFSPEIFRNVATKAEKPCVFRNVNMGSCTTKWADPAYLKSVEGETVVSVHVAEGSHLLDFVRKNFTFRHVQFSELVDHLVSSNAYHREHGEVPQETWYYRSVSTHMKTERSDVWKDFSALGKDLVLPPGVDSFVGPRLHQSCLRINTAPLQLWTHYDTMDNVLLQVTGRKRVVLFPPSQYNNLYMSGSSSPVIDLDHPDLVQYPRMIEALKHSTEVTLEPGDMLYFPANWFHHITTLQGDTPLVISVNAFFHHFESPDYDAKDLYGNKDLPAVTQLRESILNQTRAAMASAQVNPGCALPVEYKEFALRQIIHDLESLANDITAGAQTL